MHYVYLIESIHFPAERYVGVTHDLKLRLAQHNSGESAYTAEMRPWRLVTYVAFNSQRKAEAFEKYLKSGSGHAFARKHLW
jgi:predicted GIY-YIG superfamily endonuclease